MDSENLAEKLIKEKIEERKKKAPEEALRLIRSMLARKSKLGDLEIKSDFRILYIDKNVEIREYPPHKRTINLAYKSRDEKKRYIKSSIFVPMPYCIFAKRKTHPEGKKKFVERDGQRYNTDYRGFYLGFAKEPIKTSLDFIYMPTLPNMYEDFKICEGSSGGYNFDNRVTNYWTSDFLPEETPFGLNALHSIPKIYELTRKNGDFYKSWSQVSIEDMLEGINYKRTRIERTKFCLNCHFGYDKKELEEIKTRVECYDCGYPFETPIVDGINYLICPNCEYAFEYEYYSE